MDIAAKKLELMQQLMSIVDEKTLDHIAAFFKSEVPDLAEEDAEISDEEYAAFQEEIAKCERGEIQFHTREGSLRMIREGDQE